jgi:predicted enzyme related to lactoylglutathione lyase
MNERNPVGWFEIYVQDMPRARQFYEAVLGFTLEKLEAGDLEMWAFPMAGDKPGTAGSLVRMAGIPSGGNSTLVYFSCRDCSEQAARVAAAGGQLVREKFSIGQYGFVALAQDPDRNMFGLHSMQ